MATQFPYRDRTMAARLQHAAQYFSSIVLLGARQVGKSTLLQHIFPDYQYITFDPVLDIHGARADPELFLKTHKPPLILDEVQYAPEIIPVLKRHIDNNKQPGSYFLTGSQQWGVLQQINESLAGRTAIFQLDGFNLREIAEQSENKISWLARWLDDPEAFVTHVQQRIPLQRTLAETVWRGFMPEAHFMPLDLISTFHGSYQRTYIERDIRLLADITDLTSFGRFVRLAAALTAQEINYSKLGRDIGITPQTAKRWLELLTYTFEWFEIPAFSNNAVKRISSKPKGYFSDTGQICFAQMISSPYAVCSHPLWGAIFESAVVAEIRKQCNELVTPPQMYRWRLHSGAECDLILERDGKYYPIEIKANSNPSRKDARGIQSFRETYPHLNVQKGLIIAPVDAMYAVTQNDVVIPWDLD